MYHTIRITRTAGQPDFDPDGSYLGPFCKTIVASEMRINKVSVGRRETEFFFSGSGPMEAPFLVMLFDLARQHGRMDYNLLARESANPDLV